MIFGRHAITVVYKDLIISTIVDKRSQSDII